MSAISQSSDAAVIVQKQLDAYNARDIHALYEVGSSRQFSSVATLSIPSKMSS
jgi:hypothetical protein